MWADLRTGFRTFRRAAPAATKEGAPLSWQDDLRSLDNALAVGGITADEYRVRRDDILASATSLGSPQAAAPVPNPAEATQTMQPVSPPPPPQQDRTQVVSNSGGEAERTQIVSSSDMGADRTQAVSWQAERPGDAERTQVVRGVPQQSFAPHANQGYSPAPWDAEQPAEEGSPWGGGEFPPLASMGTPNWVRQGPEVFEDSGGGGKGRVIAIVLSVLLVAGLGVGAFMLWGRDSSSAGPQTSSSAPPSKSKPTKSTTTKPPDPLPVAVLPGKEEKHKEIKDFATVPGLNYLNPEELAAYQAATPGMSKFNVRHLTSGSRAVFLLVKAGDDALAKVAVAALRDVQVENAAVLSPTAPAGVFVTEIEAKAGQPAQIRAHYTKGETIVRVEVWNPTSLAAAKADFDTVLAEQLKVLPADA